VMPLWWPIQRASDELDVAFAICLGLHRMFSPYDWPSKDTSLWGGTHYL
jgi:hypothetical protein